MTAMGSSPAAVMSLNQWHAMAEHLPVEPAGTNGRCTSKAAVVQAWPEVG